MPARYDLSAVRRALVALLVAGAALAISGGSAGAGSIFITGHDPDFHSLAGNPAGAQRINQVAISFVTDTAFNPYAAGAPMFLFVESNIPVPSGHIRGKNGVIASGYVEGADFEHHDVSTLMAELNLLGTKYCAIVVASDFGGTLTQGELDVLNARRTDIVNFLNAGGGLYAMSESNGGAGLTPSGGHFYFLPFVITSTLFNQVESGITVTPYGASLGLTNADVNGNVSHCIFLGAGPLNVVDVDPAGDILSLAGRPETVPVEAVTWGKLRSLFR
jgi:hypothetical protein